MGLMGLLERADDFLAGRFVGQRGFFGEGLAGDGECSRRAVAALQQALGEHARCRRRPDSPSRRICRRASGRR